MHMRARRVLHAEPLNDSSSDIASLHRKHLQVVWQFRAASIARVHGDEGVACGHQPDVHALKSEGAEFGSLGTLNGEHLLSDDTQNLQLNTIELIKTGPSSTAGQTLACTNHSVSSELLLTCDRMLHQCHMIQALRVISSSHELSTSRVAQKEPSQN